MTVNLRTVKKDLAAAYPEVEFTYGTAGRGRQSGHAITWKGGPSEFDVHMAGHLAACNWRTVWHIVRTMSDVEQAAYDAKQNADPNVWGSDAWVADTEAREARQAAQRAANRKAGAAQAAETRTRNRVLKDKLAVAFPDVDFDVTTRGFKWTDGPTRNEVETVMGFNYHYHRYESLPVRQARLVREAEERAAWEAGVPAREAERVRLDAFEELYYEALDEDAEREELAEQAEAERLERLAEFGTETVPDARQLLMFA